MLDLLPPMYHSRAFPIRLGDSVQEPPFRILGKSRLIHHHHDDDDNHPPTTTIYHHDDGDGSNDPTTTTTNIYDGNGSSKNPSTTTTNIYDGSGSKNPPTTTTTTTNITSLPFEIDRNYNPALFDLLQNGDPIPYHEKLPKAFWRGATTSATSTSGGGWDPHDSSSSSSSCLLPRRCVVELWALSNSSLVDVGFTYICQHAENYKGE